MLSFCKTSTTNSVVSTKLTMPRDQTDASPAVSATVPEIALHLDTAKVSPAAACLQLQLQLQLQFTKSAVLTKPSMSKDQTNASPAVSVTVPELATDSDGAEVFLAADPQSHQVASTSKSLELRPVNKSLSSLISF